MEFTTVIAVDRSTLAQLAVSLPTWRLNRPEIFERPIVVMFDRTFGGDELRQLNRILGESEGVQQRYSWPPAAVPDSAYSSQRERMLSAFLAGAAAHVTTPVWVKIDTDVIALARSEQPLVEPAWFPSSYRDCETWGGVDQQSIPARGIPAFVASRWGYTKNKDGRPWLTLLDEWADGLARAGHPAFAGTLPLAIPSPPGQLRVAHRRHCSWVAAYRTDWTRELVATFGDRPWKMPVPSQDTVAHYFAARRKDLFLLTSFKAKWLTNCPREKGLREAAERVLSGERARMENQCHARS